jgi:predicted dehydrogenase
MSPEPIRVGLIGVGQIGKHHLREYQKVPGAEVVAVADVNEAEAQRVAAEFNIPHVYTDLRAMLAREDIQAVDVALHNNLHSSATIAALEAGKHVFCEKPMAGSYRDAEAMYETAGRVGKHLSIQLSTLFETPVKAAHWLIENGHLGKVYHARSVGHRRRGRPFVDGYGSPLFVQKQHAQGGALYDMGVYHIARILYLMGNPTPLTISGVTYQETEMDAARRERSGYNVEELGMGFVRLEGGATLDIIEAWAVHLDTLGSSVVLGNQGGLRLEPFAYFRSIGDLDMNSTTDLGGFDWRFHTVHEGGDAYDSNQHHWIAALQGRVPLLPTARLALNTMLISEGIYRSTRLGREVTAEEVRAESVSTAIQI